LIGRVKRSPRRQLAVNGVAVVSTRAITRSQTKLSETVADEGAGQQTRLAQDLEAVADAGARGRRAARGATTAAMIGENFAIAPQRR